MGKILNWSVLDVVFDVVLEKYSHFELAVFDLSKINVHIAILILLVNLESQISFIQTATKNWQYWSKYNISNLCNNNNKFFIL